MAEILVSLADLRPNDGSYCVVATNRKIAAALAILMPIAAILIPVYNAVIGHKTIWDQTNHFSSPSVPILGIAATGFMIIRYWPSAIDALAGQRAAIYISEGSVTFFRREWPITADMELAVSKNAVSLKIGGEAVCQKRAFFIKSARLGLNRYNIS